MKERETGRQTYRREKECSEVRMSERNREGLGVGGERHADRAIQ